MTGYRGVSFWLDQLVASGRDDLTPRPPLDGDRSADVCIIGGGLTGLWTAWYLHQGDPSLQIVVVEREIAGFGASGRNGGWCSALFPRSAESIAQHDGREAALAMRAAMRDTVDEVGRAAAEADIDCDYVKGGTVLYARSEVQDRAARAEVASSSDWGDDMTYRDGRRGDATDTLGVAWTPDCARVQPAALVRGLAAALEARGVVIAEHTPAVSWAPGRVVTTRGTVSAGAVVVATEGYGASLEQTKRRILPLYSLMIATAPLPASAWERIGLEHGQTFSDYRHLLVYGQRTADDRLAFGGRGARYHWGSSITPGYDRVPRVFQHLRRSLVELFPVVADAAITHTWGGPLGVPRDWCASVTWDGSVGSAGGYVGDGLSTTNLAGRTLADLVRGVSTPLTALPWVGHRSPDWEPEPLRFLGANAGLVATDLADREERLTGRASLAARLMAPLTGGH
ncbi:glycine/D-amino acid oxidase-like deaminating enzyme [Curtobacterium sp. PhB130]|uniref:NAD(P)/FAD-dependent oxidoreductase n=1 Tax=Curtobacterium sp. PhB130 TaxID=2485178 RepID=UPI000F4B35B6|nr:FAD-dependent oxidoreductase [Curtobacterium sp. PhB130]ROS77794.1 glycine/D-amino acid oxidase-like deaminating enzyme [Curtobacterium sp. PhB130]